MKLQLLSAVVLSLSLTATSAMADKITGTFKAQTACDAYLSFNKGTNPGRIRTVPGAQYEMVETNNKEMSWIRIKVPNLGKDPLRWVAGECGTKDFTKPGPVEPPEPIEPVPGPGETGKKNCNKKNTFDSYVLAMSWQPAFCEYATHGPKPECDALEEGKLVIDHLTLHGLWPNKKACGTGYGNCGGPKLDLDQTTVSQLSPWMPNFYYDDDLGTHEWDKHGTCQQLADDDYFLNALRLVKAVDESTVGTMIKSRSGGSFTTQEFFSNVARDYGQDVADRIQLICAKGRYLQEIRVNFPQTLGAGNDLKQLTAGAPRVQGRTSQCSGDTLFIESIGTVPKKELGLPRY